MSSGTSNYAAGFIITNFLLAYIVFSPRPIKAYLKIDRNTAPRDDLSKYGATDVRKGRISQETLEVLKRLEACHANGLEHLPLFIGSMVRIGHHLVCTSQPDRLSIRPPCWSAKWDHHLRRYCVHDFEDSIHRGICIWHNLGHK